MSDISMDDGIQAKVTLPVGQRARKKVDIYMEKVPAMIIHENTVKTTPLTRTCRVNAPQLESIVLASFRKARESSP